MLLHDAALATAISTGSLGIEPFSPGSIQPSSVDLLLDDEFVIIETVRGADMDVRQNNSKAGHRVKVPHDDYFLLRPEHFVLASTVERVRIGRGYAARIEGKSSLGRLGLMVHSTAGFIDPGFEGQVTLELSNMLQVPIRLYPGMPVAQLAVFMMSGQAKPYEGKYQHQTGPATSQYHRNFDYGTSVTDDTGVGTSEGGES
jgi:dCTP deaminase